MRQLALGIGGDERAIAPEWMTPHMQEALVMLMADGLLAVVVADSKGKPGGPGGDDDGE